MPPSPCCKVYPNDTKERAVFLLEEAWGVVLRKGTPVVTGVFLHDLQVLRVEERPEA